MNQHLTNFKAITSSIKKLPTNRSAGHDDIHAEHLIHAHRAIAIYLGLLFNACLMHGFIPPNCLTTMLVPVSKSSVKDVRDPNNYRPIALASVISKLFERII